MASPKLSSSAVKTSELGDDEKKIAKKKSKQEKGYKKNHENKTTENQIFYRSLLQK